MLFLALSFLNLPLSLADNAKVQCNVTDTDKNEREIAALQIENSPIYRNPSNVKEEASSVDSEETD